QEVAVRIEVVQDPGLLGAIEVHAAHRDRDDFRARRLEGASHRVVIAILARAHHEARVERATAHDERRVPDGVYGHGHACQPPPTKCTSSIASPAATVTSPSLGRRTIARLCSTTTARGSSSSARSSSSSVAPRTTLRGSPFTSTSIESFTTATPRASAGLRPRDRLHPTARGSRRHRKLPRPAPP